MKFEQIEFVPDCSNSYESSFSPPKNGCEESNGRHPIKLRLNSTLSEIFDAMKSPHFGGLTFFNKVQGLPSLTFIGKYFGQFHQCFMHAFFIQNQIEKLSLVTFQLCNFWRHNFVQKTPM